MDKLVIEGGTELHGTVEISGAKNAALPILISAILTSKKCLFENVPSLMDISTTVSLLEMMGIEVEHDAAKHTVEINASKLTRYEAPYDLVRTMRASVLVLGPLLARLGKAKVSLPGGCSIGARPVNLHLMALEKMGADITVEGGYIQASAKKLRGADITFDTISVGATENTMMAAALAEGQTVLRNAAREPEIVDLAVCLRKMGAKIEGEGSSTIQINGVSTLGAVTHSIIADRIEAGTVLVAAAMTGGEIYLPGVSEELLEAVLEKLRATGAQISASADGIRLKSTKPPHAIDIQTMPFPGFPTDMQAQMMALMSVSDGVSVISENIFENRFMHVAELQRLGADITIQGHTAIVRGSASNQHSLGGKLTGATVMATDLRASASLVLAGLAAEGATTVRRIYHLDRGYEKLEVKLEKIGAKIRREKESK